MILNDTTRALLDGKNFAVVATVGPDGAPHSSVVWVDRDGDTVVFTLTDDKQKARNLRRDGRAAIAVFDLANPYNSAEIRGTVELEPDPAKALPERLSQKYLGVSPPAESPEQVRLVARLTPQKVHNFQA
jgi:PPOX class probable F420-dependent enzyme